jgi:hypothetical protein
METIKILQKEAQSAHQIGMQLGSSNDSIVIALQEMLEENIIQLNRTNQFCLK